MSDLYDKLKSEILGVTWLDLQDHLARETVFVVSQDLDLTEVGTKVAIDEVESVSTWINDQSLTRPTPEQREAWDREPAKLFHFLIVQPYVLIQEQAH